MPGERPGILPPPIRREPIKRPVDTERKLQYLDSLNDMLALDLPSDMRGDLARRAQMVCESIESDLNLGKG